MIAKPASFRDATFRLQALELRVKKSRGTEHYWTCVSEYHEFNTWYKRHFENQIENKRLSGRSSDF